LLDRAEVGAVDNLVRARVHLLRAQIRFASTRGSDAPLLLFSAARELETVDPALARATYLEAISAGQFAGWLAQGISLAEISEAALRGPQPPRPLCPSDRLLQGLAVRFTDGYAAAAPILKRALTAFKSEPILAPDQARWLVLACKVATDLWDDESLTVLSARALTRCRHAGALSAMPIALNDRSWTHMISGELAAAASLLDEARAISEAAGVASVPYAQLWLTALQGNESAFMRLVETMIKEAVSRGEGGVSGMTETVTAVLYNGLGRYDAAMAAFRASNQRSDPAGWLRRPESELIEAAVRCGEHQVAACALERMVGTTRDSGTDWALGIEARSRALLSDGETAESLYREAIERLARTRVRVQLARAHLLYGEWLRRERRRREARDELRTALEMFTSMGTEAFAQRSQRELLATGEHARKRSAETRNDLTPREAEIARMAVDGLSNAEIGTRLVVSQSTVAYHLRHVFSKLNIASRHQLASVLGDGLTTHEPATGASPTPK
jgi:DNA-binding CsgD family transcriptional regulator